jgi:hypothetical protein
MMPTGKETLFYSAQCQGIIDRIDLTLGGETYAHGSQRIFGSLFSQTDDADADADVDGDGDGNGRIGYEEYLASTDPKKQLPPYRQNLRHRNAAEAFQSPRSARAEKLTASNAPPASPPTSGPLSRKMSQAMSPKILHRHHPEHITPYLLPHRRHAKQLSCPPGGTEKVAEKWPKRTFRAQ